MKVYNISPHRSGTRSFASFCGAHGLRTAHWCGPEAEAGAEAAVGYGLNPREAEPVLWQAFEEYYASADVFADLPTPLVYRMPLNFDRDAKFIFVERDAGAWIRSVRRHKAGEPLTYLEAMFYRKIVGHGADHLDEYDDGQLEVAYRRFHPGLEHHEFGGPFRTNLRRLLIVHLDDPLIGERISQFMGFEMRHPFPREGA